MSAKLPIIKEPHPQPLPACGESTRRLPVPSRRSGEPGGGGELKRSFGSLGFRLLNCLEYNKEKRGEIFLSFFLLIYITNIVYM